MQSWIKTINFNNDSNKNIICLPFAGGYSAAYRPLRPYLNSDWNLITLDPPGHGTNKMHLIEDLEELVSLYIHELADAFTDEFILFGHSMGGRLVHRMEQVLETRNKMAKATIVSACLPPNYEISPKLKIHSDKELLDYVISLGGFPKEFHNHPELIDYFLPIFKADFKAMESHVYPTEQVIKSPLYILSGELDVHCTESDLQDWRKSGDKVSFSTIEGGHMFIETHRSDVANFINNVVKEIESTHA